MRGGVLVCGAGQIGTSAARSIAELGGRVVAVDLDPSFAFFKTFGPQNGCPLIVGDVLDQSFVESLIDHYSIESLVLSTGHNSHTVNNDHDLIWKLNIQGTEAVASAAQRKGVTRVVFLSSFAVYGPGSTNYASEDSRLNPQTVYGCAKMAAERYLISNREKKVDFRILRPCGIYGPRPPGSGSKAARLIDNLLVHAINGTALTVTGSQTVADEYLYVKDLGRAVAQVVLQESGSAHFVFNVGAGKKTTLSELLSAISRVVPTARFHIDEEGGYGDVGIPALDLFRIRSTYGFEPQYGLTEGLADYLRETEFVS